MVTVLRFLPPYIATEKEIERYRAMISDPMSNPGFLAVDRGEALWAESALRLLGIEKEEET